LGFEITLFFLSILGLGVLLFARDWWRAAREGWRVRRMEVLLVRLLGHRVEEAEALLGPVSELATGSDGRRLYVWKGPTGQRVPRAPSLLIVSITTNEEGKILDFAQETR
jgi:hypothetical protein